MARKFIDLIMKIFPCLRLNSNARWSKMTTKFSLHLPIAWILDVQWDPTFMLSYSVSFSCSVCLFDFFNFWWSIFPKTRKWRFSKKQSSFPYPKGALECILEAYSIFLNSTHSQQDIKTTDHRPTDHWQLSHRPTDPTDPPTHWPNNHWPNRQDSISKTWTIKNIHFTEYKHSWEDVELYFGLLSIWWRKTFIKSLLILIKSLSLVSFKRKLLFYKAYGGFNYVHFRFETLLLYSSRDILNISQFVSTHGNFSKTRCFFTWQHSVRGSI